jgi:hypothetical protein
MQMQSFQPPCPQQNFKYEDGKHVFLFLSKFFVFEGHRLKMGPSLQCYSGMAYLHIAAGGEGYSYYE